MAERPPAERGAVYRSLGVEPLINGRSTYTILGGALMPPVVLDAMREAAQSFVDLTELEAAVGQRIAELTRNEAAFVTGGAAAGLFLSAAAAMTRDVPDGILRLAELDTMPREFVIHRAHRVPYDSAIELAGGRLVEIGRADGTDEADLVGALGPATAGIFYVPRSFLADAVLPLEVVVRHARERGVPVIVDAAAQLPPVESLWRFTEMGAEVALFSGGKALCGPSSTGLVLGRRSFIDRIAANAAPLHRLGRPMKVGKEDLVGIVTAVEWYLGLDLGAQWRDFSAIVDFLVDWGRERNDIEVVREETGEAGQPTPRARLRLVDATPADRDELARRLREGRPRIDLLVWPDDLLYVAPETLLPGEERVIARRLDELLDERAAS
jgi:L-seryl-tRNA(Ser) seleniumtransferase